MRVLATLVAIGFATAAAADPKPQAPTKVEAAKPACKPKYVGKGLERKVVCVFEKDIVLHAEPPKPKVIYVSEGGKKVTGRPRTTDPFKGLRRGRTN